ncbi:ECF transporter S component [Johnsonella ignava]|uniref:ECF transporter S component n=1 Tax=Johnsonella ignava TaxID=43995 RepID=UPI0023F42D68|nr:ECF transporter S component [Johnsonella ignava]
MEKHKKSKNTQNMVLMSVFAAIIAIQTVVPFLGFIPVGVMNATIVHITVIIGAVMLGPYYGACLGLFFGLASMWKNTFMPNATSFCFSPFISVGGFHGGYKSIIVCFVPRILIGIVAYYIYKAFKNSNHEKTGLAAAGALGSMVNTIFVMLFIYLLFRNEYSGSMKNPLPVEHLPMYIVGIIGTQGILEAVVSSLITFAVSNALIKYKNSM